MNPAFLIIVLIGAMALWLAATRFFRKVGGVVHDIRDEVIEEISEESENVDITVE